MTIPSHTSSNSNMSYVFRTPRGKSTVAIVPPSAPYETFVRALLERSAETDQDNVNLQLSRLCLGVRRESPSHQGRLVRRRTDIDKYIESRSESPSTVSSRDCSWDKSLDSPPRDCRMEPVNFSNLAYVVFDGKILGPKEYRNLTAKHLESSSPETHHISLRLRLRGGVDRQNRVGSKFGGGGVSSGQQSERERKERLRQLALETVDLAKDPYLMRNHLGTYECKLCLTLHTNEG